MDKKDKSNALYRHKLETNHTFDWKESGVILLERRERPRKILENLIIKNREDNINLNEGWGINNCWDKDVKCKILKDFNFKILK